VTDIKPRPRLDDGPAGAVASFSGVRKAAKSGHRSSVENLVSYIVMILVTLGAWWALSTRIHPLFLPGPQAVFKTGIEMTSDGTLLQHIRASYYRIIVGWVIGSAVAVPLGLLAGRAKIFRLAFYPYINFFRFIPPIAFVTLSLIYFGIGEASKIALVVYASMFIVVLNTMNGAASVPIDKVRAAQCLGANHRQVLLGVVIPATIPDIVTGLRVSMGAAFMTVIAAELVAAQTGVGFMLFNARVLARTDIVFLAIIVLGLMGLLADWILRVVLTRVAYRYEVNL